MQLDKMTKKDLLKLLKNFQAESHGIKNIPSIGELDKDLHKILTNNTQVGCYILQNKRFQFINPYFRDYSGYSEDKLLKMNPISLILSADRRKAIKNAVMMLKEQRFSPYEFRIITGDGRIKWIMETVMSINYMGQRAVLGNTMDVTEHKEASRRLEELEALESSILDAIPQAVLGLHERNINFANNAVKIIFGWHREEMIGKSITMIYRTRSEADHIADIFYSTLEKQRTFETEFPCIRKDGRDILCRMKAARIGEKLREKRIVVTYEDITVQKKAQLELERSREELRNLSGHLQFVREEERASVARKIHDELGQSLTALQMDLSWLTSRLPTNNNVICEKTRSMSDLVNATIESIHDITAKLRPSLLDDLGLQAAVEWQISDFHNRFGMRCHAHFHCGDAVINKTLATAVFRILQEILTNIARHSKATHYRLNLTTNEKELCLEVTDNGIGITQWQIDDTKSFGIIGMRERAHLLGGTVQVRNAKTSGTTVKVLIPVDQGDIAKDDKNTGCRRSRRGTAGCKADPGGPQRYGCRGRGAKRCRNAE